MASEKEEIYGLLGIAQEHQKIAEQQQQKVNELITALPDVIEHSAKQLEQRQQQLHKEHQQLLLHFKSESEKIVHWRAVIYTTITCLIAGVLLLFGSWFMSDHYIKSAIRAKATYDEFQSLDAAFLGDCRLKNGTIGTCVSVTSDQEGGMIDGHEVRILETH